MGLATRVQNTYNFYLEELPTVYKLMDGYIGSLVK